MTTPAPIATVTAASHSACFVLTRFNVPLPWTKSNFGLDDKWLEHRFALFENFCLPSVAGQTKRDFCWLLLIDAKTPDRWRARLERDLRVVPKAVIIPAPVWNEGHYRSEIQRLTATAAPSMIVSTRLDNDDAIARDYLGAISKAAESVRSKNRHFVVNFRRGCQLSKTGVFGVSFKLNAFLSMVSPASELKTAYSHEHGKMDEIAPVIDNRGFFNRSPYWLQVIHTVNIANDLNRKRKPLDESVLKRFALGSDWRSLL
ncbi:MAG: glycosyltransferase [Limisphaerales bacterium]